MNFESFRTVAEIAVGLTGFVGIIVVLQRRLGGYPRVLLLTFLQLTLGATFFALLPDFLSDLFAPERMWRVATGSFGIYHLAIFVQHQWKRWRIWEYGLVQALVTIASLPVILLKLGVGLGFLGAFAYSIHYLGLLWFLGVACYGFVLILFDENAEEAAETHTVAP